MKRIITISREFGSGGHSIGQKVAEKLDLNFYDQALLEKIAQETGLSKEYIENSEYAPARNSLLFNIVVNRSLTNYAEPSPADMVYFAQTKIIQEIAEKESCVIVGRCSDYILRERRDALHVFIYADLDSRSKRILERYGEIDKPILKRIEDKDARRKIYYSHYTDRPRGVPQNYHVSLSSSALGEDVCVNTIVDLFQKCDG